MILGAFSPIYQNILFSIGLFSHSGGLTNWLAIYMLFEKIPYVEYLYALNKRNNFYIESHHPLRETIINQTGNSQEERREFLQKMFDVSIGHIPVKWGPNELYGEPL